MKQVLIIDDEPIMRKLLEQILKDKYEVISLENGREGLEWMYSGNIPDLVVADLNMPEINGFEYIKKVRESGFFNDVPLIVLSGEESSSERINWAPMITSLSHLIPKNWGCALTT